MAMGKMKRFRKAPTGVSKKVKAYVKKAIKQDGEHRVFLSGNDGTLTVAGTVLNDLTEDIAVGDTIDNRNGPQITCSRLRSKFVFTGSSTALTVMQTVRFLIGVDNGTDGTAPTVSDVLTSTSAINTDAPYNPDNYLKKRFRILYDRQFNIAPNFTASESSNSSVVISINKKLNFKSHYDASDVCIKGNIFMIVMTSNVTGAGATYTSQHQLDFNA